jgi:hypothetical protein
LQEFTAQIAKESGLDLKPEEAWRWLAQGGFIQDELSLGFAGIHFTLFDDLTDHLGELPDTRATDSNNIFDIHLDGSVHEDLAQYQYGKVSRIGCLRREGKIWPLHGPFGLWYTVLQMARTTPEIGQALSRIFDKDLDPSLQSAKMFQIGTALNVLVADGWIKASFDPAFPKLKRMNYSHTISKHEADSPLQTVSGARKSSAKGA